MNKKCLYVRAPALSGLQQSKSLSCKREVIPYLRCCKSLYVKQKEMLFYENLTRINEMQ